MRIPRLLPGLLLAAAAACGSGEGGMEPPTDDIGGTFTEEVVRMDGQPRRYLAFVPDGLPAQNRPLLIAFHGQGSTPDAFFSVTGLDFLADSLGFVVIFPGALDLGWLPRDTTFFNLLVDSAAVRHGTDPSRAHVLGFSQGGGLGHLLACQRADRVKSLMVIGTSLVRETAEGCDPSEPTHVFYLIGTQDAVAPWRESSQALGGEGSAEFWAQANGCEGEPERVENTSTIRLNWDGCQNGARVRMIGVIQGGHFFFPRESFDTLGELADWLPPIL